MNKIWDEWLQKEEGKKDKRYEYFKSCLEEKRKSWVWIIEIRSKEERFRARKLVGKKTDLIVTWEIVV